VKRIVAILSVAALAGCGTGEDEQQIRAFLDERERPVEVEGTPEPTATGEPGFGVSEAILVEISEVEDVDVDGDTAEARYDDGYVQRLRKVEGRWIIEGEAQVRRTLGADARAHKALDWAAVCALRTGEARRRYCPETDESTTLGNEPIVTFSFTERRPPAIDIDGDRATVRHESGSVTELRKVNGRWLISAEG
jgi:hypothetical protein